MAIKSDGKEGFDDQGHHDKIKLRDAWAHKLFGLFGAEAKVFLFTLTVGDRYGEKPSPYWVEVEFTKVEKLLPAFLAQYVAFLEIAKGKGHTKRPHIHGACVYRESMLKDYGYQMNIEDNIVNASDEDILQLCFQKTWTAGTIDLQKVRSNLMTMRYIAKDNRMVGFYDGRTNRNTGKLLQ